MPTPCPTCAGTGKLTATTSRGPVWTPCPPCSGEGHSSNGSTKWDAGPAVEWRRS
jgi:DnaJ-class molecular chaperone